jgi:hypothetical protein
MTLKTVLSIILCTWITALSAQMALPATDSVRMAVSHQYEHPSFFGRIFLGKNYRKVWSQPVTFPVFHMKEQGFKIKELGGGQQTKSLRLLDKNGQEWALRSIDKTVLPTAVPPSLRYKFVLNVIQSMVSASYPYAPLIVPGMAQATGVVAADPVFYYVPDDPDFGEYRALFAHTICMLEDREPTPDDSETESTGDLVEELLEDPGNAVDQKATLNARLLDMMVADWDRHQDQWRWGIRDSAGVKYFYGIPRDRDQAMFLSNGLLVKIARLFGLKHMVGFTSGTRNLTKLNAKAWNFDRTFLNELDAAQWQQIIRQFQSQLTDEVIRTAVHQLPPEIYALNGPEIESKLISRRNSLLKDGMAYYEFLSENVTVIGTDAAETFTISQAGDSIRITVQSNREGKIQTIYSRSFSRDDTYEINLIGLGGDDSFRSENIGSKIRFNIDGGKGNNTYALNGSLRKKVQDSEADAQSFEPILKELLKIKDEE